MSGIAMPPHHLGSQHQYIDAWQALLMASWTSSVSVDLGQQNSSVSYMILSWGTASSFEVVLRVVFDYSGLGLPW